MTNPTPTTRAADVEVLRAGIDKLRSQYSPISHAECLNLALAIERLLAENEAWSNAAQNGHGDPCELGPLCPYCQIASLTAERDALREDRERLDWVNETPPPIVIRIARQFRDDDTREDADIRGLIDAARERARREKEE